VDEEWELSLPPLRAPSTVTLSELFVSDSFRQGTLQYYFNIAISFSYLTDLFKGLNQISSLRFTTILGA